MEINKKEIHQKSRNENLIPMQGEAHSTLLSSTCVENEQVNVHRYMNYDKGFFSFSRMENGCLPNRFYPTLDEAYRMTLTSYRDTMKAPNSKNNIFRISDSMHNILYEGRIAPSGKIIFSIYNGKGERVVSTIDKEINNSTIKNENDMENYSNSKASAVNNNELKNNDMAVTISSNAKVYLENNILTKANVKFLCLSENCAKSIAQSVQKTAIDNKNADDKNFIKAIAKASGNMICITKTLASGKPIDNNHVSFHEDLLYCASHCKSKKFLFDGSNTWKKAPGKIAYNKVYDSIMEMYHAGQKMLLDADTTKIRPAAVTSVHINTATTDCKKSLNDVVKDITATIMTYLRLSTDMRCYLDIKKATLDSDLESLSNGVIFGKISNDRIILNIKSGHSKELMLNDYPTDELLRNAIGTNVSQLFVCASLSDKTRNLVSAFVELASIEEFYIKMTLQQVQTITDAPIEKSYIEKATTDNTNIDRYNSLIAERLCGIIDSDPYTGTRDRQVFIRTFLKTCAAIAGLPEDMDISMLEGQIVDPFYKGLVMEYLNDLTQPQYSQVA